MCCFVIKDGPVHYSSASLALDDTKVDALALFVRNALWRNCHCDEASS